jgi:adenylate cyclase
MRFLTELKRRNVIRVGTAYLVFSWFTIQASATVFPLFGFGDVHVQSIFIVLAIGYIPVLIFVWSFGLTPGGLRKESDIDRDTLASPQGSKMLDRLIMVALALGVAYFAFDKFVLARQQLAFERAQMAEALASAQDTGPSESSAESDNTPSIAVLPFVDMSLNNDQEYFSDGISEELLNLLVKIPELRVISRTSAFSYKGKDVKIKDIGQELNVAHVLEGSVRKAGNTIRITAQLIDAASDTHIWSETYDRPLDDIFAVQDEIAAEVVKYLKLTLLGDLPTTKASSLEAYSLYLLGRHLHAQRSRDSLELAQSKLQQSLAINPDYVPAWSELASVHVSQGLIGSRSFSESKLLAHEALNTALEIHQDYAPALAQLAFLSLYFDNNPREAVKHLERALELDPRNTLIIGTAATLSGTQGQQGNAIILERYIVAHDPINPVGHSNLGLYLSAIGRHEQALTSFQTALVLSPGHASGPSKVSKTLLLLNRPQAALEAIELEEAPIWKAIGLTLAYYAAGRSEDSDRELRVLIANYAQLAAYNIAYIFAYRDEPDRAFEWLVRARETGDSGLSEILLEPLFANLYDDERWPEFLETVGKAPEQLSELEFNFRLPE